MPATTATRGDCDVGNYWTHDLQKKVARAAPKLSINKQTLDVIDEKDVERRRTLLCRVCEQLSSGVLSFCAEGLCSHGNYVARHNAAGRNRLV